MRKIVALSAAALMACTATVAFADTNRLNVPRGEWLPTNQIVEKLQAQGYTVTEIETDDGAYEVEMTKNGIRQEAHVHPATGEIMVGYDD